jgi:hypothetical protein
MRKHGYVIGFMAILLFSFAVGCGDSDKNANAGKPGDPLSPPTVTLTTPADGNVAICPSSATVSATFSKAMNPATISTSTFKLSGPNGTNVAGAVLYTSSTSVATFVPSTSLAPSTKFTATITTGVADVFGNMMASDFVWTFTTSPSCALAAPTVTVVTPPDQNVTTCPESVNVSAAFSKAMNPATINGSTFTLSGPGGVSVAGAVTYTAATHTATFTPSTSLASSTKYTATIAAGVSDTLGNTLSVPFVWTFTTSTSCATTPPTVVQVTPPNSNVAICPETAIVSANFSKAMNPTSINSSTFTLKGTGGASVAGTVTYVAATEVATFTPLAPLSPNTTYNATITTGVADTFGNTLAANFGWTFVTSASCTLPPVLGLGSACSFGILAGSTVTNVTGTATTVSGNVGVWPGSAVTGFGPPASITGTIDAGNAVAQIAQGDLTTAYNNAAGAAGGAVLTANIGGQTLPPGVYRTTSAQPSLGITGNLTLDGKGDPNASWIFQIVTTLTTAAGNSNVILINGAQSKNVIWQVGSSATLGTNTIFTGTIMAQASVTATTGSTLNGRALARSGGVTLDTTTVVVPTCP